MPEPLEPDHGQFLAGVHREVYPAQHDRVSEKIDTPRNSAMGLIGRRPGPSRSPARKSPLQSSDRYRGRVAHKQEQEAHQGERLQVPVGVGTGFPGHAQKFDHGYDGQKRRLLEHGE